MSDLTPEHETRPLDEVVADVHSGLAANGQDRVLRLLSGSVLGEVQGLDDRLEHTNRAGVIAQEDAPALVGPEEVDE